jgi:hypothetical protein
MLPGGEDHRSTPAQIEKNKHTLVSAKDQARKSNTHIEPLA